MVKKIRDIVTTQVTPCTSKFKAKGGNKDLRAIFSVHPEPLITLVALNVLNKHFAFDL